MSAILFIRHAETDMAGTFCGHSDPDLNARGKVQMIELINRLRPEDIGAVYASDLRRAHSTGTAIASAFAVDCHVRPALREINFGRWEGLTWKEIEGRDETYARKWVSERPHLPAPGGERFCDFEHRVIDEVKLLLKEAETKDRPIAVVTHAGVLRTVLCGLTGCSEEDAWEQTRSYCCVFRYNCAASALMQPVEVGP